MPNFHNNADAQLKVMEDALAEFAYTVSHDLGAPLRQCTTFAHLLDSKFGEEIQPKARHYLDHVLQGSRRAQSMLEGLLIYSRLNTQAAPMAENVDANIVVAQAIASQQGAINARNARISVGPLPFVRADEIQLVQLCCSLLSNSLKFSDNVDQPIITISGATANNGWHFTFTDNGIGIAPRDYNDIFRPLRQLHPPGIYSGVGMGLAVARKIVERHGGQLWVESEAGKGATFHFTLT